ncbi:alpha/beta hydrolase [Actinoallomurus sp. NBC_01490]|jgi:pimeloyl-ACP methyl ester carboxylesterase|uniref:alpha/beta fold hydrolase n=1 Tax=Actinoallomurus sp. NBC_01490 TaxID=2903557 RepID=UPI002E36B8EA|nr:alpha/beta hydrolase [Actinoallomurus sp. NBC_01490]
MRKTVLPEPVLARTVRGSGPGLVLSHGANGSIERQFGPILDGLAADHTVVGVDLPGSGATARSETPLDIDQLADQLVAAADAEGLDTFTIAGISLGGPIGIRAAVRHPDRVTALVLTATFARPDAKVRLFNSIWRQLYESGDRRLLAEFGALMAFSTRTLNTMPSERLQATIERIAGAFPPGTPEQADLLERIDVSDDLSQIEVPALVVVTIGDWLVPPETQRCLADRIPGAKSADIATGHAPFGEDPDEWLRTITAFLRRNRPQDAEEAGRPG